MESSYLWQAQVRLDQRVFLGGSVPFGVVLLEEPDENMRSEDLETNIDKLQSDVKLWAKYKPGEGTASREDDGGSQH